MTAKQQTGRPVNLAQDWPLLIKASLVVAIVLLLGLIGLKGLAERESRPKTQAELDTIKFKELVRKHPENPLNYVKLGNVQLETGFDEEAMASFGKAVKVDKKFVLGYLGIAKTALVLGDEKKAQSALETALEYDGERAETLYLLGDLYIKRKEYKQAEKLVKRRLAQDPLASDAHVLLGQVYEATQRKKDAIFEYKEALRFVPDFEPARAGLARLERKGGKK